MKIKTWELMENISKNKIFITKFQFGLKETGNHEGPVKNPHI